MNWCKFIGIIICVVGLVLVWSQAGPWAAIGVYVVVVGNSIEEAG